MKKKPPVQPKQPKQPVHGSMEQRAGFAPVTPSAHQHRASGIPKGWQTRNGKTLLKPHEKFPAPPLPGAHIKGC